MNDPIAAALALLGISDPNIHVAGRDRMPRRSTVSDPRAWTTNGNIFVGDWTETYRRAQKGDAKALTALAAILAHERFHRDVTPDEGPAYETQLDVLKQLKAPAGELAKVKTAQRTVAPRWRGWLPSKPLTMRDLLVGLAQAR